MATETKIVTNVALLTRHNSLITEDEVKNGEAAKIIADLKVIAKNIEATRDRKRKIRGISAPQIDVTKTICMVRKLTGGWLVLINPVIVNKAATITTNYETCLSFPGKPFEVTRYTLISVRYLDTKGKLRMRDFKGKMARRIQHEIDHLNSIVPSKRQFEKGAAFWIARTGGLPK